MNYELSYKINNFLRQRRKNVSYCLNLIKFIEGKNDKENKIVLDWLRINSKGIFLGEDYLPEFYLDSFENFEEYFNQFEKLQIFR